jgi:hypothetical protein
MELVEGLNQTRVIQDGVLRGRVKPFIFSRALLTASPKPGMIM